MTTLDVKRTLQQRNISQRRSSRQDSPANRSFSINGAVSASSEYPFSPVSHTIKDRRQAQALAHKLLMLCKCSRCEQIIRDPVTLPCGHSSCLSCIVAMTSTSTLASTSKILPSTTLLPPRLPLSSTTVPCPIDGCPRSAIGQGMGIWSGHKALYGPRVTTDVMDWPSSAVEGEGAASTSGPMDGFVAPQNQERNRLVVIPAQLRSTYLEKYAISKYNIESCPVTSEAGLLRPDVTLSKTLELLRRYAQALVESSLPLPRRPAARSHGRGNNANLQRRSRRIRALHNEDEGSSHHPAGTRTEIHPHFLPALGVSEKGMETGAVGGIRATWDSDDEESLEQSHATRRDHLWSLAREEEDAYSTAAEDDQDDEIGGAFARQYTPPIASSENEDSWSRMRSTMQQASKTPILPSKLLTPELLHSELLDVLECQLCYMLLYQPLTTPCGHTFCRQCFARSLDHSSTCPLCRADMPSFAFFQEHPSNNIVLNLLTAEWAEEAVKDNLAPIPPSHLSSVPSDASKANVALQHLGFKQLYQSRQISMEREARESLLSTPLFVCTLAFPHMPTILHIFEPRYRLMIRRCLESGYARFGMVLHSSDTTGPVPGMSRYGTMLEIKTVQMLPDGRSMIETVGSHRFRVLERGSLDGYTVGQIERIDDVDPEMEDELERSSLGVVDSNAPPSVLAEAREAQAAFQAAIGIDLSRGEEQQQQASSMLDNFAQRDTTQLIQVCIDFIETLQSGSAPWLMTRLNNTYGPMPESSNVAAFGYWMALVMPIDEHEKSKLLPIRSARLRLRIVVHWIEQLRQTWWFNHGCSVQ